MSLIFKEKDYEFIYKSRLVQFVQTTDDPLRPDRPKTQTQRGRKMNIQIKTKGNFADPLNRQQTAPKVQNNPLARPQTVPQKPQQPPPQQPQQQQQSLQKIEVVETDEKKRMTAELSVQWQEIRQDFVRIFDVQNYDLEQTISNPFGNQVQSLTQYDGPAKPAYSGDSKIEQTPQQKTIPSKQILQRIYIQKVLDIRRDLRRNWLNNDKVASLQLAIQSCKLLIDNERPLFAPIKYIYVIDILETFGKFVIERLLKLSYPHYSDQKIAEISLQNVLGSNISEIASEIGRNWLIKIGSIRELIPRLYVEATLLKVYYFIDQNQLKVIFNRLVKHVRAIGDYINAMYFALYLFRIGAELFSGEKDYLLSTLRDFFKYMNQKNRFCKPDIPQDKYMELFEPVLVQLFRQYSQNCTTREFTEIYEYFRSSTQNPVVLRTMINEFQATHICGLALELFSIMQGYQLDQKYQLYACFLPKIAKGLVNRQAGAEICQLVLQDCAHIKSFTLFLDILAALIDLIFRSFQGYQKNQFFFEILSRFNDLFLQTDREVFNEKENRDIYTKLRSFIVRVFRDSDNITEILQIDTFVSCVAFFPKDMKRDVCIELLQYILRKEQEPYMDQVAVHSIISLMKHLNEKNNTYPELYKIVSVFLQKIDFGKDFELFLNIYAEIRANFGNVPGVSEELINRAISLVLKAKKYAKGKNQKKVLQFLQACIAFAYITIPTIELHTERTRSYLAVSQTGLSLQLISQSESIVQTAIEGLLDVPKEVKGRLAEDVFKDLIAEVLSFLIVVPDDPSGDYLRLFSGYYALIGQFPWSTKNGKASQLVSYANCLQYLCAQVQDRLPYHIDNLKSNDALFNKEGAFKEAIVEKVQEIYTQIGEHAAQLLQCEKDENVNVIRALLHVINRIILLFKINDYTSITQLLNVLAKKVVDMDKERTSKAQLTHVKQFILQTIFTLEKLQFDIQEQKARIVKVLDLIK